jgi:hypothetical protein
MGESEARYRIRLLSEFAVRTTDPGLARIAQKAAMRLIRENP